MNEDEEKKKIRKILDLIFLENNNNDRSKFPDIIFNYFVDKLYEKKINSNSNNLTYEEILNNFIIVVKKHNNIEYQYKIKNNNNIETYINNVIEKEKKEIEDEKRKNKEIEKEKIEEKTINKIEDEKRKKQIEDGKIENQKENNLPVLPTTQKSVFGFLIFRAKQNQDGGWTFDPIDKRNVLNIYGKPIDITKDTVEQLKIVEKKDNNKVIENLDNLLSNSIKKNIEDEFLYYKNEKTDKVKNGKYKDKPIATSDILLTSIEKCKTNINNNTDIIQNYRDFLNYFNYFIFNNNNNIEININKILISLKYLTSNFSSDDILLYTEHIYTVLKYIDNIQMEIKIEENDFLDFDY